VRDGSQRSPWAGSSLSTCLVRRSTNTPVVIAARSACSSSALAVSVLVVSVLVVLVLVVSAACATEKPTALPANTVV
jgi:hypothetical protein